MPIIRKRPEAEPEATKQPTPRLPDPKDQGVRLAINLCDLERVTPFIRGILFKIGRDDCLLDLATAILVDPYRFDETAVAFTCDLLTAACCVDTVRAHDKRVKDYPTRAYVFRERSWTKLSGDAHLAVVTGDKAFLNPKLFPRSITPAAGKAPPIRRIVPADEGGD